MKARMYGARLRTLFLKDVLWLLLLLLGSINAKAVETEIMQKGVISGTIIDEKGELQNVLSMQSTVRRQDMPQYYLVDGSVYVNRIETLSESTSFNDNPIPYIMDAKYSVDIDEPSDLEQAETLLKKYT